jgi:hypothetical protein
MCNALAEVAVEVKMVVGVMGRAIEEATKVAHEVAVVDALERFRRRVGVFAWASTSRSSN